MNRKIYYNYIKTEISSKFWSFNIKHNYGFYIFIFTFFIFLKLLYWVLVDLAMVEDIESNLILIVFMTTIVLSCSDSLNSGSKAIEGERGSGTLEQLYLSPIPFYQILLTRNLISIITKPIYILILLQLFIWINGIDLKLNHLNFLFLTALTILPLLGVGYTLAGISLIYRGFNRFSSIIIFFILGGMILPVYPFNTLSLIPFFPQVYTLRLTFIENQVFDLSWYLYLILNSVIYFIIGIYIFIRMEKKSKIKDLLFRR